MVNSLETQGSATYEAVVVEPSMAEKIAWKKFAMDFARRLSKLFFLINFVTYFTLYFANRRLG